MRKWLNDRPDIVKRVKMMALLATVGEMIAASFTGFFEPDSVGTFHAIGMELGAIYALYQDPDEWNL